MVFVRAVGGLDPGRTVFIAVVAALLHELAQRLGVGLVQQLPFGRATEGDDGVPVRHRGDAPGVGADGVAHLAGEILQVPHGGVFAEDHASVFFGVDLKGIALPDAEGAADLFGDDDTT